MVIWNAGLPGLPPTWTPTWSHERIVLETGEVLSDGGPVLSAHYAIGKPNQICEKGKWYIPVKEEITAGVRTVTVRPE